MPTQSHENTINTSLGEVLGNYIGNWNIRSENVGRIFEEARTPGHLN